MGLNASLHLGSDQMAPQRFDLTMRFIVVIASLLAVAAPAAAQETATASVRISTADIHTFWQAFDRLKSAATHADTLAVFAEHYFARTTAGGSTFIAKRLKKPDDLLFAMNMLPRYYRAIRPNTLRLQEQEPIIRAGFQRLQRLYPATKLSDVFFVMGGFTTQGTMSDRGILIGAEMVAADSTTPMDELPPFMRDVDLTTRVIPCIVIHELVHEQQNYAAGKTLLRQALVEGVADFVGEKAVGCFPSAKALYAWGNAHEREQWEEFRKVMNETDLSQWFYNGAGSGGRPGNLGYWMGYRIAASYYDNASDKTKAIADLLNIQDFDALLAASGYTERMAR